MNTYRKKRLLSITYSAFVFLCLLVAESTFTPKLIYAAPLHLAWNANTEEDLSGYRVYYGRVSGHYELYVDVGNVTEYMLDDIGFQQDVIYYIAITAYDTSGNESDFSTEMEYVADDDVLGGADNCPDTYNPNQEDTYPPQGNGIGDACDCEGDFDCDGDVDSEDIREFLFDFGRDRFNDPCTNDWCNGDFNCDGDVDADDLAKIVEDLGRSYLNNPCPPCVAGAWCEY
jgi:hypothetical protein